MALFSAAKAAAPSTETKSKKTKFIVPVQLGDKLRQLQAARDEIAAQEAIVETLEGDIKPTVREEWLKLMKRLGVEPDSFIIQSAGFNMLAITQDKYLKMTATKEQMLKENKFGDFIQETTEFSFDPVILQKHEKAIEKALEKAIKSIDTMSDDEKDRLIKAKVVKSVKKGALSLLPKTKNADLAFQLLEPIIQLKNQPNED
jgi:hypothetical protein